MNSSIHLCTLYTRHTVNDYYIFQKAPDHYSERESPCVRSLASIRYSSFIAHVHGKCSVNGKPSLCIDPERHRYPRQSRSWTRLYRRYNATPLMLPRTIDTAVLHSRRENGDRCRFGIHGGTGIIPRPSSSSPTVQRYQVNVNCAMNLRGSVYSRGGRVTLADLVRSSSDTPDRS